MKRLFAVLIIGMSVFAFNSCILDPKETPPDPSKPVVAYKDLAEARDNVLFNLEKSYSERNIDQYDQLLDAGFVFHFSNADIKNGDVSVSQWGRAADLATAGNMFDPNFSKPGQAAVSSIDLTLTYAPGEDSWNKITPPDQVNYPDEFWYEKTLRYTLTVEAGDFTYISNNIQVSFVVRWANVDGEEFWRIIIWRDDTES
jgi:hypothetical protein